MNETKQKTLTLSQYDKLSKTIKKVNDIQIQSVKLLDVYERFDSDFDRFNGRGICVRLNYGIKLVWFESSDTVIAMATLMSNKTHVKTIKKRIIDCLLDKLFIYNQLSSSVSFTDNNFGKVHKKFIDNLYNG